MPANPAGQALGNAANQRRGNEIRFNPHFQQAGHGADAVIGMQGRKDQVAGLGGAHCNLRSLEIADLPDEDNVRVVAQDRAQACGKGQADLVANLDLDGAFELVFDGIFEGDDLSVFVISLRQSRVEGSCFAATGRAGEEDKTLRKLG